MTAARQEILPVRPFFVYTVMKEEKALRFDLVVSFDAEDRHAVFEETLADVQKAFPEYQLQVALDTDYSEV